MTVITYNDTLTSPLCLRKSEVFKSNFSQIKCHCKSYTVDDLRLVTPVFFFNFLRKFRY